ncbi:unnamed protein product [Protopolystoma xenopodis]|uniref:Uncharacterized protein n=1 Tax=Protopolystoma xenopodis TaxID=117903 RepID=A0A3S5BW57_9PLAT|nr:unnamed protein product [Protopolystoma xenopodis]
MHDTRGDSTAGLHATIASPLPSASREITRLFVRLSKQTRGQRSNLVGCFCFPFLGRFCTHAHTRVELHTNGHCSLVALLYGSDLSNSVEPLSSCDPSSGRHIAHNYTT